MENAIYYTGDIHGDIERITGWMDEIRRQDIKEAVLFQLGDAGLNFYMDERDRRLKEKLQKKIDEWKLDGRNIQILFVRGNHEGRPSGSSSYREEILYGGRAYVEEAYKDLIFLKDGEVYRIGSGAEKKKFLVIGGGYSDDFFSRVLQGQEGAGYWFDEQLDDDEFDRIEDTAGKITDRIYVLSHMLPVRWAPERNSESDGKNGHGQAPRTEIRLQRIADLLGERVVKWIAGHYHVDEINDQFEIVYRDIRKLK